jgi:hypothetical protein
MRTWLLALFLIGTTMALAQDITGGLNNSNQAVISGTGSGGGLNNPTIISSGSGGGGGSCAGVIDLTTGCPQPMLGF